MNYTTEQLKEILTKHAEWIAGNSKGVRANLRYADLRRANLSSANLRYADLRRANLSSANLSSANLHRADLHGADLHGANLSSADLSYTDMIGANLRYADLSSADLSSADLSSADLRRANLRYANMDYSSGIPLWCGGADFKCEAKLIQQVLAHLCALDCKDKEWIALRKVIRPFAKKSHRVFDLGLVKPKKG